MSSFYMTWEIELFFRVISDIMGEYLHKDGFKAMLGFLVDLFLYQNRSVIVFYLQ